jgi:hypothetical protein
MERETIKIRDVHDQDYPEDWEGYILIEQDECDFDAEKGFVDYKCVVQRISDDKYFGFKYTQFGYNGSDLLDQTMKEVFEKTKTITVYE